MKQKKHQIGKTWFKQHRCPGVQKKDTRSSSNELQNSSLLLHPLSRRATLSAGAPKTHREQSRNPLPTLLLWESSWSQPNSPHPTKPERQNMPLATEQSYSQANRQLTRHHFPHVWHFILPFWSPKPKQQTCWLCSKEFECDFPAICWSHIRRLFRGYLHLAAGVTCFLLFLFFLGFPRGETKRQMLQAKGEVRRWPCAAGHGFVLSGRAAPGSLGNVLAARLQIQPSSFAALLYGWDSPDPPRCCHSKALRDKVIFWFGLFFSDADKEQVLSLRIEPDFCWKSVCAAACAVFSVQACRKYSLPLTHTMV